MRVILTQNLKPSDGLYNGSQGTILRFETQADTQSQGHTNEYGATGFGSHAAYRHASLKLFIKNNGYDEQSQPWPVVKFDNGQVRRICADCAVDSLGQKDFYSISSVTQIPLIPGYAITVHRSWVRRLRTPVCND
jgi:ATP-dependent DNA helicase PIF1